MKGELTLAQMDHRGGCAIEQGIQLRGQRAQQLIRITVHPQFACEAQDFFDMPGCQRGSTVRAVGPLHGPAPPPLKKIFKNGVAGGEVAVIALRHLLPKYPARICFVFSVPCQLVDSTSGYWHISPQWIDCTKSMCFFYQPFSSRMPMHRCYGTSVALAGWSAILIPLILPGCIDASRRKSTPAPE